MVTRQIGDTQRIGVITVIQTTVLEIPTGGTAHRHQSQQHTITIQLYNLAIVRRTVKCPVNDWGTVICCHRCAKTALAFTFSVGIADDCTDRGWRRGIDRHHLRRGRADVACLVDDPHLVSVITVSQIAGISVAPALVSYGCVNPGIAAVEAYLHALIACQRAAQRTVNGQRGVHGDEVAAGLPGIFANAVNSDAILRCHGIDSNYLRGRRPYVTGLIHHANLIAVIAIAERAGIGIAPACSIHRGVGPCSPTIKAHLDILIFARFRTQRTVQSV